MDTEKLLLEIVQRLARVEDKIKTDLEYMSENVKKVEEKLDNLDSKLDTTKISYQELETRYSALEKDVLDIKEQVTELKTNYNKSLITILGVLFSIVVFFVVPFFSK